MEKIEKARSPRGAAWLRLRWARRATQVVALALFVYLLLDATQSHATRPTNDLFVRFDPLAAFVTMLSGRAWLPGLSLALVTVVVTLAMGRVWCGWLCPLGTVLGALRFKAARRRSLRLPVRLHLTKYALLVVIVVMAVFGFATLLVFDPIGLLVRTATTVLIPGLDYTVTRVESAMMHVGALQGGVNFIEDHLRGSLLPPAQPHYSGVVVLGLVVVGVVALNAFADRFWCRYLCPLGALLGLLAKVAVLRPVVSAGCSSCRRCETACRIGAIVSVESGDERATEIAPSECTVCLDCLVACPGEQGVSFATGFKPAPWRAYDPGRRDFLVAAAAGIGSVALLGSGAWAQRRDSRLIRPPGVTDEEWFLGRCLRCGECFKVCPTSGLQPSLGEAGLTGLWTPVLKSRLGYCAYDCHACGQVCPSGAIPSLSLAAKRKQVIGVAVIDRGRCLPWARDVACGVCQEVCPLPTKAVSLIGGAEVANGLSSTDPPPRPVVDAARCIGCGACENHCPVEGVAAIRVERPTDAAAGALG